MDLDEYVRSIDEQLRASAALGDERTQQVAGVLANALDPAVRLAIVSALGAAADEITAALLDSPGAPRVAVHLDGGQVGIRVTPGATAPPPPPAPDDGEATARISLRLSEALKGRIEQAAGEEGMSVNAWLIRAAHLGLAAGKLGGRLRGGRGRGRARGGPDWGGLGWSPGWGDGMWTNAGTDSGAHDEKDQNAQGHNRMNGWIEP